jgi:tetratricopeptide (TPR) repeat protein
MISRFFFLTVLLSLPCFSQPGITAANTPDSLAAALYAEGNYWKLMEISRQFSADSLSSKFCFHLGMSYAALSEPQRAQEFLKRAIALDSAKLQYRYQYARILSQSGLYSDAVRELNRCIAMDSSYIPARFQLGFTYAAQKHDPDLEMSVFSWLIERNPKDFLSLYYMSEALKRSGKPDSAAYYLLRSLSANPRYVPALIAISNILNSKKMYVDALPYYLRADSIRGGNKDLVFQIGECYRKLGDLPKATMFFQRAIALDSMNGLYHAQLAYTYYSAQQYDSSAASYLNALLYDEENVQYYLNLALVYTKMDDTNKVMHSYNRAVKVSHPEIAAEIFYNLGTFCFQKKLWRDAVEAFGRTIDIDPAHADAYYFKGSCLMQLDQHKEALPLFEIFLHRTENDPERKGERYSAVKMVEYIKNMKKKK